jgi:nitrite reductase/ring-hydroxylating ferredoxin subunit
MTASANANPAPTPSRREFLNYAFGASIALMLAGSCGGLVWFTQQIPKKNVLGGVFTLDLAAVPTTPTVPAVFTPASAWLVNLDGRLVAFDAHCPFDRQLVKWAHVNQRFECPACGSKFQLDGSWIEFAAPRDLDRYVLEVRTTNGSRMTPPNGDPVSIEGAKSILLYTNNKILGKPRQPRSSA